MIYDLNYTCDEISRAVNGVLYGSNCLIKALSIDSRESAKVPFCFFAIKGKKYNGISYVKEAISNGAALIVAEEKINCSASVIYVENTIKALGMLAKKHKGQTQVIGITGSNGKTTTKDMIISVLKSKYSVCGTYLNYNNEIGVALTLLSIKKESFCVVEMGMRAQGEIEWLSYISEPDISVITNCGSAHIGLLGNKENIFRAKTEIFKYTKKYAILPNEQNFRELKLSGIKKIYIGKNGDFYADNIETIENSLVFDVGNCKRIKIDGIYEHNVTNALNAFAVGKLCGMHDDEIRASLKDFSIGRARGEITKIKGICIINDCYNASYESMSEAIKSLVNHFSNLNKKTAVLLGDMLEQGSFAEEMHVNIGRLCKELTIQKMFVYGEYAKQYLIGFDSGILLHNIDSIAEKLMNELDDSYVLLVKASNKVGFEKVIEKMRELAE